MALVITRPSQLSSPAASGITTNTVVIPTTHTSVVDQSTSKSNKWIITISDLPTSKIQAYEVLSVNRGTSVIYNMYGLVGDNINTDLSFSVISGVVYASVTNHELFDVLINITHISAG
jgi:hypothetical protein